VPDHKHDGRRPAGRRDPFQYAIVRVVPRVERGERINVGVILYCGQRHFLAAAVGLDESRLRALDGEASAQDLRDQLEAIVRVAAGDPTAGPIASMAPSERFGWLVAPSSTVIQASEVHTGLSEDPGKTLGTLFKELVNPVGQTR
jgi:hypothetical protein